MTVPAPRLDDLTWDDMMAAIRRRIPAESGGTWTLHAPADPGVTLLELFAYLLEQRLYWLDQAPDALVVAVLRLLGLETPRPARPAATILRLAARTDTAAVPVVPAGTALSRDLMGSVVFTLEDDVAVFPLAEGGEVTVWTDRDRTADLRARRDVALLASDGALAQARFTLPLTGELPASGPLSLLFELAAPAASVPSWLPGATDGVKPPAELTWSWFRPDSDVAGEFEKVEDGTAGLRRSGVVRLHPPSGWSTRDTGLLVSTRAATYAAPPRLRQLALNVSAAHHLLRRTARGTDLAEQITAWLKLPGQHLVLPEAMRPPAGGERAPGRRRVADGAGLHLRRVGRPDLPDRPAGGRGGVRRRTHRAHSPARPGRARRLCDRRLRTRRRPVRQRRTDRELAGGLGLAGGAGRDLGRQPGTGRGRPGPGDRRRGATARGGVPGEVTRAVTADDFVTLARTTPGVAVARAYASLGEHPGFPCSTVPGAVTVHVVPSVPRDDFTREDFAAAPQPDPGTLCAVAARLECARLLTSEVFVRAPAYREVTLRVDLSGDPADRTRVSTVVTTALRRFLDPLVGGEEQDGWPFGETLRPSALLRAAQRTLGDLADVAAVAIGLDGADATEDCDEVELRAGDLPVLRAVRIRTVPAVEPGEGLA